MKKSTGVTIAILLIIIGILIILLTITIASFVLNPIFGLIVLAVEGIVTGIIMLNLCDDE